MARVFVIILLAIMSAGAFANNGGNFFRRGEEGWFWYKDPREREPKPPRPRPPITPSAQKPEPTEVKPESKSDEPPIFSVAWLRENLDKLRDRAIDDPSPENIRAYYYAQRVMLDKADNFARASKAIVSLDPYLDENNISPFATAASNHVKRMQYAAKKQALRELTHKAGIWFFFDSKCSFCEQQVETVEHLAKEYGFSVLGISLDGQRVKGWTGPMRRDAGQFKQLGLSITPTVVLAVSPSKFLILSQGLLSKSEVDERILTAAAAEKLLSPELQREVDVFSRGILQAEDMNSEDARRLMTENPGQWVEYLRRRIHERQ